MSKFSHGFEVGDRVKVTHPVWGYEKSGVVIKVLDHYVGFRLDGYEYKNTEDCNSFLGKFINKYLKKENMSNLKPFNLERAKAGDQIIIDGDNGEYKFSVANCKDGVIYVFKMIGHNGNEWIAQVNPEGHTVSPTVSSFVYMAPVKKKYYFGSWSNYPDIREATRLYTERSQAVKIANARSEKYIIHEIEIEG